MYFSPPCPFLTQMLNALKSGRFICACKSFIKQILSSWARNGLQCEGDSFIFILVLKLFFFFFPSIFRSQEPESWPAFELINLPVLLSTPSWIYSLAWVVVDVHVKLLSMEIFYRSKNLLIICLMAMQIASKTTLDENRLWISIRFSLRSLKWSCLSFLYMIKIMEFTSWTGFWLVEHEQRILYIPLCSGLICAACHCFFILLVK